jgi:hypothetical protein
MPSAWECLLHCRQYFPSSELGKHQRVRFPIGNAGRQSPFTGIQFELTQRSCRFGQRGNLNALPFSIEG